MDKTAIFINLGTIAAIVAGPIIALQIQRKLDTEREAKNRKLWVFKTLMSFRATALNPNFVQALNLIDVEFDADNEKERAVRNAWKSLLDHYSDLGKAKDPGSDVLIEKSTQLRANLLMAMAACLGYKFDEVSVKKGSYYPTGLGNVEAEQHALRRRLLDILSGKGRIPVGIFQDTFPPITLDATPQSPAEAPAKQLED